MKTNLGTGIHSPITRYSAGHKNAAASSFFNPGVNSSRYRDYREQVYGFIFQLILELRFEMLINGWGFEHAFDYCRNRSRINLTMVSMEQRSLINWPQETFSREWSQTNSERKKVFLSREACNRFLLFSNRWLTLLNWKEQQLIYLMIERSTNKTNQWNSFLIVQCQSLKSH